MILRYRGCKTHTQSIPNQRTTPDEFVGETRSITLCLGSGLTPRGASPQLDPSRASKPSRHVLRPRPVAPSLCREVRRLERRERRGSEKQSASAGLCRGDSDPHLCRQQQQVRFSHSLCVHRGQLWPAPRPSVLETRLEEQPLPQCLLSGTRGLSDHGTALKGSPGKWRTSLWEKPAAWPGLMW